MNANFIITQLTKDELKAVVLEALTLCPNLTVKDKVAELPILLTQKEVLKMIGVSLPTLLSWRRLGIVQVVKINRSVRYRKEDIDILLKKLPSVKYSRSLCEVGL